MAEVASCCNNAIICSFVTSGQNHRVDQDLVTGDPVSVSFGVECYALYNSCDCNMLPPRETEVKEDSKFQNSRRGELGISRFSSEVSAARRCSRVLLPAAATRFALWDA